MKNIIKNSIPLVSVIMPVYNCSAYLQEAVDSILQQTMPDFELIIVNDGSTDNSSEIAHSYHDHRIVMMDKPKNTGCYPTINMGMRQAKGKYVCVMGADDICRHTRLEVQSQFMEENPEFGLTSMAFQYVNSLRPIYKETDYGLIKIMMLKFNYLSHGASMVRTDLIHRYSLYYEEEFIYASDYAWLAKAVLLFPTTNINHPLYLYRMHRKQISTAKRKEQDYYADIIRLRQLSGLGVKVSNDEIPFLLAFIQGRSVPEENWNKIPQWIQQILTANKRLNYYPPVKLKTFLDFLWTQIQQKHR